MYAVLKFVPKNQLSWLVGWFVNLRLPSVLSRAAIGYFCKKYSVNTREMAGEIEDYRSLGEFFVRELQDGARAVQGGVVCPVDGAIQAFGDIRKNRVFQVKGKDYSLEGLLLEDLLASAFQDGFFVTIYLAPGDYHHIHAPVDGRICDMYYIPGKLWPVNCWSVNNIEELFCVNERIVTVIDSSFGKVCVIKVGALNVGSIRVVYDDLLANSSHRVWKGKTGVQHRCYENPISVSRGEKIATFCLGSTVMLLFEKGRFSPGEQCRIGEIKMGASLLSSGAPLHLSENLPTNRR